MKVADLPPSCPTGKQMLSQELSQGAVTVIHLSQHFAGLKDQATALVNSVEASTRGFFTPTEDEQTRHLLVSYWQSRNALFEVVSSFHQVDRFEPQQRPTALLIAYAGALALVDVARFLREHVHHRSVVRAKLNEPEPYFGIPEGTYDLVQKSLTSPVHAWHLYHAAAYVAENREQLQTVAGNESDLVALFEIVDGLQHRMDVSVDRFILARTRSRTRELRTGIGRNLLGRALYGLQKCVSRLISDRYVKADHIPGLPAAVEAEIEQQLQPGDVIVVRKEHAFTNYFLPGYWPHAALYIGSLTELRGMQLDSHENVSPRWDQLESVDLDRPNRVLEAMKDGVRVRSLACPFKSDAIAILRPQLSREHIAEAIGRGFFHADKPYDFDFDFARSDRMVCTEVVYRSFEGIGGISFELTRRAGRLTLSAEDLLQKSMVRNGFTTLSVFCPAISDKIHYGADADGILTQTVGKKFVR
jgi:hypothetical protein